PYPKLSHHPVKGRAWYVQGLSGLFDITPGPLKRRFNCLALDLVKGQKWRAFTPDLFAVSGLEAFGQIVGLDLLPPTEQHGGFYDSFQLANVASPRIPGKLIQRRFRNPGNLFLVSQRIPVEKMARKQRQIVEAFPEGRDLDLDGADSEVQIL